MVLETNIPYLESLKNIIDIRQMPFSTRGSRLTLSLTERGLMIRLIDRVRNLDGRSQRNRGRQPIVEDLVFLDDSGNPLPFTIETYPHRLDFNTPLGQFSLIFDDIETILIRLPELACGFRGVVNLPIGVEERRGAVFSYQGDDRTRFTYTTNRAISRNQLTEIQPGRWRIDLMVKAGEPGGLLFNITSRLGLNHYIPEIRNAFYRAAQTWEDWFARVPKVAPEYQKIYYFAWWVMRSGLVSTRYHITREVMASSKVLSYAIWQWDAYFHALAFRHIDRKLAHDQLRIFLDHQRSQGMLPDAVHDDGVITHFGPTIEVDVSKPPLLTWIAWKLFESDQDKEFLSEIYENLVRWNEWWLKSSEQDADGLYEVPRLIPGDMDDPSFVEDDRSVVSPDLNTYLYLQMESLSKIAHVLGEDEAAAIWQERANVLLGQMQDQLWDGQAGLFWAQQQGRPICVPTPFSLFPLLTGKLEPEISRKLVEHLSDPEGFWNHYPMPAVALDDPDFENLSLWQGPSWVSINYLLMEGLDRSGYQTIADDLCERTLNLLAEQIVEGKGLSPEEKEGNHLRIRNAPIYGWSAALYIELAVRASRRKLLKTDS